VEGEALTSDESELLGGAVKGGAGPPLPERERTAFMGQPVSLRSSRRSGGKRALRSGPMVCYLHRNGEIVVPGEGAMLKTNPAQVPDFAKFLDDVTVKLGLMSYCKKLFRPDGTEVTSLEEIRPKEDYVASWTTEFLPPSLVPKHKSTRWNHSSPGRGAQRASPIRSSGSGSGNGSSSRGAASPARQRETRSPRRSYVRSPGRGAASAASIERTGSAGRSRPATAAAAAMAAAAAAAAVGTPQQAGAGANLSLADKRRILLEHRERSGGKRSGSPRRTVGGGGGGGGGGGSPGRSSSPAQLQSEVRRLQKDLEREIAEQRALEKRLRQLDEAEARASRDAEKQAMRLAQEEERRLAAEERQLAAAEARLAKEREDWERDRTPPPRMRAEVGERSPVASSSSGMGLGGRMGAQTARWDAPPSQQEEHAAAAKLQANYRGYATRRDMKELETIRAQRQALEDQAARQQAEREAAEQQTRMQQAELERSAAAQAALAPAPIVALALSPAASTAATTSAAAGSPGKLSAIERARQRREMKASRAEAASLQRSGQQPQQKQPEQKPRELHYATSLNTPSKRVTVAEFGAGLASGAISAASVVVWTKGMDSWKLPQAALDTFPELAPALQAAAGGGAGNGDGGDGGGATAAGQPSMAEKRRMVLEARQQQLKEELQGMKVMALFKKAHAEGVLSEEQLEVRTSRDTVTLAWQRHARARAALLLR
jgi:hypothetical protein